MPVTDGDLYYSTVGIVEPIRHFDDKGIKRVQIRLHQVDPSDGVTPNGQTTLLTTLEANVDRWILQFPRDIAERKNSLGGSKHPSKDRLLANIDRVIQKGKPDKKELLNGYT